MVAFFICGSGKVIQISATSLGAKKWVSISIFARKNATFFIPANSACLAPAHIRAPLISIPIHTIKVGDYSLPVSLEYHASGIKVAQEASRVGLAWSLHAGGSVSRSAGILSRTNELEKLRGQQSALEEKLWNGEYYNLWINENQTDESLMTDQLDGEWFLRMIGLEGNLTDERIRKVVELIFL